MSTSSSLQITTTPTFLVPVPAMDFLDDLPDDLPLFQNFSDVDSDSDALLPTGVKVTIVVVYMIICVIGLVGNFLVMYVIIRYDNYLIPKKNI